MQIVQYRIPCLVVNGEMVKEESARVLEKVVENLEEDDPAFDLAKTAVKVGKYNKTQETKILSYPDGEYQIAYRLIQ